MKTTKSAFTLVEVLLATVLLSGIVLAIVPSQRGSSQLVVRSELLIQAAQLAQLKMTEIELKLQKKINKDKVENTYESIEGTFEEPNETFRWTAKFEENPLLVTQETVTQLLADFGVDEDIAESQFKEQALLFTNLNKAMKENLGQLTIEVFYDYFGKEKKVTLVNYLLPKIPKIKFATTADSDL